MFDPAPEEPQEDDPEKRWGNPEKDLSSGLDIPSVSTPQTDEANADPELLRVFWGSVILANLGVGGVCIGPMLVYFRGQWELGGFLVVFGLFCLARTYSLYVGFRDERADGDDGDSNLD